MVMAPESAINPDLPETFWAWLAGFVDGDGTIVFEHVKMTPNERVRLSIAQKDRRPLDWIRERIGTGSVLLSRTNDVHHLRFGSSASRRIIEKLQPYLQLPDKVERAARALAWKAIGRGERSNSPEKQGNFDEVCRLYRSGLSSSEIAELLQMEQKQVLRWASRVGITRTAKQMARLRSRAMRGKPKASKHAEARAKALELWGLGEIPADIARKVGLPSQYVHYWIRAAEKGR